MMKATACMFVLLWAVDAASAQTAPVRLTLDEAISRGFEASDRLAELDARQEAMRAVESQREAGGQPQVTAIASYMRTNHIEEFSVPTALGGSRVIYPDIPNNVRTRIDLQWPIYTGGRVGAQTRAAGAEAEAAGHDRDAARADLKLDVTRSFWAVITARASSDVVRQAVERTSAHLNDVRNQLAVGLIPPSDVLTTEAQHAHERMLSIEADNIFETASAEFRRLVGLAPDTPFELVADLSASRLADLKVGSTTASRPGLVPQDPAISAAVDTALASRAERKSLQFRITAAAERVTAASAGALPVLSALGGYDVARPNVRVFPLQDVWKPSWDIGVNFRWSVFDGGRARAETAEATALRRGAEARLRDFDAGVRVEVRQRMADLSSAQASIEAAQSGVRAATEARRVLAERFNAGVATSTDVLNAQVALLQAELDLTRALANVQLAGARLDRAMGR
jgi:outer membrane protein